MFDFQNTGSNANEDLGTEHGLGSSDENDSSQSHESHGHDGQRAEAGTEFGLGAASSQDDSENGGFGGSDSAGNDSQFGQTGAQTGGYGASEEANALVDGRAQEGGASDNTPADEEAPHNPHEH